MIRSEYTAVIAEASICTFSPLTYTWPHLNSDVGLKKGEY